MRHLLLVIALSWFLPLSPAYAERHKSKLETEHRVAPPDEAYDVPPKLLSGNAPLYPISKLLKGGDGFALISFVIRTDGTTADFEVIRADHEVFGAHAIAAARKWKFAPAMKDGERVEVRVEQPFDFQAGSHRKKR